MKKLIATLRHYYQEHFHGGAFFLVSVFTALLIAFNEHFRWYEQYIEQATNTRAQILRYMMMYGLAYGGALLLEAVARRDFAPLRRARFGFVAVGAILMYVLRGLENPYQQIIPERVSGVYQNVYFKLLYNGGGLPWVMLTGLVYWWLSGDSKHQPFYGFKARGVQLSPYWVLLLLMVPLVFMASRDASFHTMYPRYQFLYLPKDVPHYALYTGLYELFYSLDFAVTEFFFRGFMLLALGKFVGSRTVLPMCVFYVTIHFGKPLAEIISSYFGGLLLGVIAWETRSIYGGIIVHLGIALLMEIMGWL